MIDNEQYTILKEIAAKFIPAEDLDDLVHEVFLQLYENPEKLNGIINNNKLKWYFIRLCKNNYYSKTSKYHYKYRRLHKEITFTNDLMRYNFVLKTEKIYFIKDSELINKLLDELYWYDRELFKLYVLGENDGKSYTYSSLSKKTKISRMNIYITIKKVKKHIKNRLKEIRNGL